MISLEKFERDKRGATVDAIFAVPFIITLVLNKSAAVKFTAYEIRYLPAVATVKVVLVPSIVIPLGSI